MRTGLQIHKQEDIKGTTYYRVKAMEVLELEGTVQTLRQECLKLTTENSLYRDIIKAFLKFTSPSS